VDIIPTSSNPVNRGKAIVEFNDRLNRKGCSPNDVEFETKVGFRVLGEGQTKWRSEWGNKTFTQKSDGKREFDVIDWGMQCRPKYRDYIRVRMQVVTEKTWYEYSPSGQAQRHTQEYKRTQPMDQAQKFDCRTLERAQNK
jgi:hypothetical protein